MNQGNFSQSGFTIVELMIVVILVGVFAAFAIPNFQVMTQNNRLTSQTNDFLGAFYLARSEAVKLHDDVVLCSSSNGTSCNGADWDQGWLIWHDDDGDTAIDNTPVEILRVGGVLDGGNTIRTRNNDGTLATLTSLTFSSRGLSSDEMSWVVCDARGAKEARAIVMGQTGRARVSEQLIAGGALVCP